MAIDGLSIIICTRDRPDDLFRCLSSVAVALKEIGALPREALVVDDGKIGESNLSALRDTMQEAQCDLRYFRKGGAPGLLKSRESGIRNAGYDVVLFLDDDVQIEPAYLRLLVQEYRARPEVAGVGGVDVLLDARGVAGVLKMLYEEFFLMNSGRPGSLSICTQNGSLRLWSKQTRDFYTDFLTGCNMSFRKSALQEFFIPNCFRGYSIGEDLFLSVLARKKGRLLISPAMKVRHNCSPRSRDGWEAVARSRTVNIFYLNGLRTGCRDLTFAYMWSVLGFFMRDLFTACFGASNVAALRGRASGTIRAYAAGVKECASLRRFDSQ